MKKLGRMLREFLDHIRGRIYHPLSPFLKHWTESVRFIAQFLVPGRVQLKEEFKASEFGKAVAERINRVLIAVIIILGLLLVAVFFRIWEGSTWEKWANSSAQFYRQIASSHWHVFFVALLLILTTFAAGVWVFRRSSPRGGGTKLTAKQENYEPAAPRVLVQPSDSAPAARGDTVQSRAPATEVVAAPDSDRKPSASTELTVPAPPMTPPEGAAIPKPEFTLPKPDGTALGKLLQRVPFLIIGTAISSLFFAFAWAASHISGPIASFIAAFIALGALMVLIRATWHWLTGLTWADFTKKARRVTADVLIDWVVPPIHQAKAQQEATTLLSWADEIQAAQSQFRLFRLLVNGAVVIGGSMLAYITIEKLTEQNNVAKTATLTTIIDQQFQEESAEAEQAYLEIRDILLRSTSSNPSSQDEQIYALKSIPAAMLKKVTKAKESSASQNGAFSVVREASFPNLPKLKSLLRYYIVIDRAGHALRNAQINSGLDPKLRSNRLSEDERKVVATLMPITNQLLITLHELGPRLHNRPPYQKDDCLWNWGQERHPGLPPPEPRRFGDVDDAEPYVTKFPLIGGNTSGLPIDLKLESNQRIVDGHVEVEIRPLVDLRHLESSTLENGSFPSFDPFRALLNERSAGQLGQAIANYEPAYRNALVKQWGALRLAEGQSANYSNWTGSNLTRSCFNGASMLGGIFDFCFLYEVSCMSASLSKCQFGSVELSGMLNQCNLSETLWLGGRLWNPPEAMSTNRVSVCANQADLSSALFIGTDFDDLEANLANIISATFLDCTIRKGRWDYAHCERSDFWMCRIGEDMGEPNGPPRVTMVGANLVDTKWGGSFLRRLDFRGALVGANCWEPGSESFPKAGPDHLGTDPENPNFWYELWSEGSGFAPFGPSKWGEVSIHQPWAAFDHCVFGLVEVCLISSGSNNDKKSKEELELHLKKLRAHSSKYKNAIAGSRYPVQSYDEIVKVMGEKWVTKGSFSTEIDAIPELSTNGAGMNGSGQKGAFGEEGIWIDSYTLDSMKAARVCRPSDVLVIVLYQYYDCTPG